MTTEQYPVSRDTYNLASPADRQRLVVRPDDSSTTQQPLMPAESEADLATWFGDFLHVHGYKFVHIRPAQTSRTRINKKGEKKNVWVTPVSGDGEGFEDYFVWHEEYKPQFNYGHCFFLAELKSETGTLAGKQKAIHESHRKAGILVFVWRPSDRPAIERLLG